VKVFPERNITSDEVEVFGYRVVATFLFLDQRQHANRDIDPATTTQIISSCRGGTGLGFCLGKFDAHERYRQRRGKIPLICPKSDGPDTWVDDNDCAGWLHPAARAATRPALSSESNA
jgi:hypothetical protein